MTQSKNSRLLRLAKQSAIWMIWQVTQLLQFGPLAQLLQSRQLLLARLWASIVLLAVVCRRVSSSVTLPAGGPATGRSGGWHCTVGQSCYVPLRRNLVAITSFLVTYSGRSRTITDICCWQLDVTELDRRYYTIGRSHIIYRYVVINVTVFSKASLYCKLGLWWPVSVEWPYATYTNAKKNRPFSGLQHQAQFGLNPALAASVYAWLLFSHWIRQCIFVVFHI